MPPSESPRGQKKTSKRFSNRKQTRVNSLARIAAREAEDRGRGRRRVQRSNTFSSPKIYKSLIVKIVYDVFNTGTSKHVALFNKSRKNITNFIQQSSLKEGFLVAEMICTGTL